MDIRVVPIDEHDETAWHVTLLNDDTNMGEFQVTATEDEVNEYAPTADGHALVAATFRFLLEREEPEMILERFCISDVPGYYPDFKDEIDGYF